MKRSILAAAFCVLLSPSVTLAQVGTAFTYQGRLADASAPANGAYDLEMKLFDALSSGAQVGSTLTLGDISVANGLFTVSLDFGAAAFTGNKRWLQIGVRPGISTGAYSLLSARQELTPVPNAVFSASAATVTGIVPIANGGTGSATQNFVDVSTTQTIGGSKTFSSNVGIAGTLNAPLIKQNGNNVCDESGNCPLFPILPIANGGTGSATQNFVDLTTSQTVAGNKTLTGNLLLGSSTLTTGNILKGGNRFIHNFGFQNTFIGENAGNLTMNASQNTAAGTQALSSDTTGNSNTASGVFALQNNTTGSNNTANGVTALQSNTTGVQNTATGANALSSNTSGSNNLALGVSAGSNLTTGNNNIDIGHAGVAGEANTLRIGFGQTTTFIAGISGATVSGGLPVSILPSGQLGTVTSSRRYKDDIADMDAASSKLMKLRPVTFHYKVDQDASHPLLQYGLIAEEVEEVDPDLVARSSDGQVESVFYQFLPPMLLNEYQKQQRRIEAQAAELVSLKGQLAELATLKQEVASMGELLKSLSLRLAATAGSQIDSEHAKP